MHRHAIARTFPQLQAFQSAAILVLAAALCGCTAPALRPSGTLDASAGSTLALKMAGTPGEAGTRFASFPLVQGSVIGRVTTPSILLIQATPEGIVGLPMDELARRVQPLAKPLRAELVQAGLSAQPADLRLARIGTFIFDNSLEFTDGAGICDQATRDSLALIYADRPGTIKGALPIDQHGAETLYTHDLKIPAAGFHWVRFKSLDSTHTSLVIDDAPRRAGTGRQLTIAFCVEEGSSMKPLTRIKQPSPCRPDQPPQRTAATRRSAS